MALVTLANPVTGISGTIGNLTYARVGPIQTVRRKARKARRRNSQNQQPHRIQAAAAYWRRVKCNPELLAFYSSLPRAPWMGCYQFAVRDFLHGPEVKGIDVTGYSGGEGEIIRVEAVDDSGVLAVRVRILDTEGKELEGGSAELSQAGWMYSTQRTLAPGTIVHIEATATDRPGNTASKTCLGYAE